jgi:hypothetical protein
MDDNGISKVTVKARVMPGCFFILYRFWLRLDGVCVKMFDTRVFHAFETDHLVVECTKKSLDFSTLLEKCGKPEGNAYYNEVNNFMWAMEETERFSRTVKLGSEVGLGEKTEL